MAQKSFNNSEIIRNLIHPFISIMIPYIFVVCLISLFFDLLSLQFQYRRSVYIVLFLVSLCEAVAGNILASERAGVYSRLRELILILFVEYCILLFFNPTPVPVKFIPTYVTLIFWFLSIFQWFLSYSLHEKLREREYLFAIIEKTPKQDIQAIVRNSGGFGPAIKNAMSRGKATVIAMCFILSIFIFLAWWTEVYITIPTWLMIIFLFLLSFYTITLFNGYSNELFFLGQGISIPPYLRQKRAVLGTLVISAALGLALIISSGKSLLPLSLIAAFVNWFLSLFPKGEMKPMELEIPNIQNQNQIAINKMLGTIEQKEPWLDLASIFMALKKYFIAAAIIALLYFLLRPFFSRDFREFLKEKRKTNPILQWMKQISAYLNRMFRNILFILYSILNKNKLSANEAGIDHEEGESLKHLTKEQKILKRKERNHIIGGILRLLLWGRRNGYPWRRQMPLEWAAQFKDLEELYPEVRSVMDIFEESYFSPHLLPRERFHTFNRSLRKALKYKFGDQGV